MAAVETPPQGQADDLSGTPLDGLLLITEDEYSVADTLQRRLEMAGIASGILARAVLDSPEHLAREIDSLRERHGQVKGLIHLAGLSTAPMPEALAPWREITAIEAKSLFHLAKCCVLDLRESQGIIITASLLGGHFGRDGHATPGLPASGAGSGLLKTLALEWPEVRVRAIDFHEQEKDIADKILQELAIHDREEQEIGYREGMRFRFEPVAVPLSSRGEPSLKPGSEWVVLALGGARGITAEIVDELLVPGMTLILIGRIPEPDPEPDATKTIQDIPGLRAFFIEESRGRNETPTPRKIEQRISRLQRERAIRQNLAHFREAGARVEYHGVDVRDTEDFGVILDGIYERHGRIDVVIQGAGIIEDKLLVDKTDASFHRVFDTKADSTFLLYRHLRPETLKLVILFASVAGRTGNRGQADYAAANEVLNRFAWRMRGEWPNTRIVSINWGPWEMSGMASDDVNRQFRERGVVPIPPEAGRRFIGDEISYGQPHEVELIAGIFPAMDKKPERDTLPFIQSSPVRTREDGTITLAYAFALAREPYLGDHRIDGRPVVPAAIAMELLAEFAQAAYPDRTVTEVRSLQVLRGITVEEDAEREVLLRAGPGSAMNDVLHVDAEILARETGHPLYRATVILESQPGPTRMDHGWARLTSSQEPPALADAYRKYCFHGPILRTLTGIDGLSPEGMDAGIHATVPIEWIEKIPSHAIWLFDPGLVDGALQSLLIWTQIKRGKFTLPYRFGRVARFGRSDCTPCHLALRIKDSSQDKFIADMGIFNNSGYLYLLLEDIEVYARA